MGRESVCADLHYESTPVITADLDHVVRAERATTAFGCVGHLSRSDGVFVWGAGLRPDEGHVHSRPVGFLPGLRLAEEFCPAHVTPPCPSACALAPWRTSLVPTVPASPCPSPLSPAL